LDFINNSNSATWLLLGSRRWSAVTQYHKCVMWWWPTVHHIWNNKETGTARNKQQVQLDCDSTQLKRKWLHGSS